ncbi:MAG: hypothetical protein ACK58T_11520 [Phycisphaerae bacterium]|jgi:hypothetical protein
MGDFNFTRFLGVVGRLGSDFENERAIAGAMASAMLRDAGLTWADVLQLPQPEQPAPRPKPRYHEAGRDLVLDLMSIIDALPSGRADFVMGCHAQRSPLSEKQIMALQSAWQRHFGQAARA